MFCKAAAEKLKAADASLELLDAPVNLLPPAGPAFSLRRPCILQAVLEVLPADEKTLDVVKDMGREAKGIALHPASPLHLGRP